MGAVVSESVELATILLTDLVGSTRLATSVGPVRADELREEHFGLLRQAIASTGGQEVKNLGDGLMVAFGSASGAVSCAVAMQQLFERRYGQAEQGLHVRIGLGAGESTVKDGDYFGMPTVEAARLCAQAPADGILISALVKTLAGRCEGVEFVSTGLLELKGLPEPAEAFSVSWAPLGEEASVAGGWPLPDRQLRPRFDPLRAHRAVGRPGRLERRHRLRTRPHVAGPARGLHGRARAGRSALGVRVRFSGDPRPASVGSPRPFGLGAGARRARRCCSSTRTCRPRARALARARLRRLRGAGCRSRRGAVNRLDVTGRCGAVLSPG
jgi:class 3 adenylate cyclase